MALHAVPGSVRRKSRGHPRGTSQPQPDARRHVPFCIHHDFQRLCWHRRPQKARAWSCSRQHHRLALSIILGVQTGSQAAPFVILPRSPAILALLGTAALGSGLTASLSNGGAWRTLGSTDTVRVLGPGSGIRIAGWWCEERLHAINFYSSSPQLVVSSAGVSHLAVAAVRLAHLGQQNLGRGSVGHTRRVQGCVGRCSRRHAKGGSSVLAGQSGQIKV